MACERHRSVFQCECVSGLFSKTFRLSSKFPSKRSKKMASSSSSRHVAPKFGKVAVHDFPLSYYYKVATASFVCGAAVEAFMIHTYDFLNPLFFQLAGNSKINTPLTHTLFYSLSLSLSLSLLFVLKQRVLRKSDADRSEQTG